MNRALDELEVYRLAMEIGEQVWRLVSQWDHFARDTVGRQLVRAADSVAANLSEGYGRFFYKENRQYGYYSRGSLYETRTWLTKAFSRELISSAEFRSLEQEIVSLGRQLNNYIKSIGAGTSSVAECPGAYDAPITHDSSPPMPNAQ
jgi:four helix bundle protein